MRSPQADRHVDEASMSPETLRAGLSGPKDQNIPDQAQKYPRFDKNIPERVKNFQKAPNIAFLAKLELT